MIVAIRSVRAGDTKLLLIKNMCWSVGLRPLVSDDQVARARSSPKSARNERFEDEAHRFGRESFARAQNYAAYA